MQNQGRKAKDSLPFAFAFNHFSANADPQNIMAGKLNRGIIWVKRDELNAVFIIYHFFYNAFLSVDNKNADIAAVNRGLFSD